MSDYYEILGVDKNATKDEIKSAFRKMARKWHPDINKAPDAEEKFKELGKAYETLMDDDKRATYDRYGEDGLYDIIYDTNGSKGPNILSNCLGTVAGARDSVANSAADAAQSDCNDKAKRVIKDQFLIRLRGAQAVPSGAASKWAFAN